MLGLTLAFPSCSLKVIQQAQVQTQQPNHTPGTKHSRIKAAFQKSNIRDPEEALVKSPQRPKINDLPLRGKPGTGQSLQRCCLG